MWEQALRRLGAPSVTLNPFTATNAPTERQESEALGGLLHTSMTYVGVPWIHLWLSCPPEERGGGKNTAVVLLRKSGKAEVSFCRRTRICYMKL